MSTRSIYRYMDLLQKLEAETEKAFDKHCRKYGIERSQDIEIENVCLTNGEMVNNPSCVFKGVVNIRPENLSIFTHSMDNYDKRTLKIQTFIFGGKRVYRVKTTYWYDYITKKIRFAPEC